LPICAESAIKPQSVSRSMNCLWCRQPKRVAVSSNYSNLTCGRQNPSPVRSSSVTNAHFDYAEMAVDSNQTATNSSSAENNDGCFDYADIGVDSSESQSTVGDSACVDTPFAQESLGNTVIHFDTVDHRSCDYIRCVSKMLLPFMF